MPMTPAQQLKLLTERLQIARKGIILLHDPKAQTAAMLPAFLRYLRDKPLPRGPCRSGRCQNRVRQGTLKPKSRQIQSIEPPFAVPRVSMASSVGMKPGFYDR
jgi:hypothetical protein